jgi:hypothetical protein
MLIALAMAAVGVVVGLRFKVFALVPVALVGGFADFCIGMTCGDAAWSIMLTAFLGVTALQLGYLAGIVLYFRMVRVRGRGHSNIITIPQRY